MGILWFGNAKGIEDFKVKDLRSERLRQEVEQDQLLGKMRRAQDEYDGLLDAASEPGLSDAERDVAAYKMDWAIKRKTRAESELQSVLTRLQVIDSTVDLLENKAELQKKGIWKKIADLDTDDLSDQLEKLAIERKEGALNVNKIAEVLDVSGVDVQATRTPGFRRSREAIEEAAKNKLA
jgi:hypothetical protein